MISLQLLGGCSVRIEDRVPNGEAGQARRMALLVLMASAPTGAITREKLIGFLWPDASSEQARHLLSESLYQLRRVLGPYVILAERERIRLDPDRVSSDVSEFERALARGDLAHAVERYGGPFLDGFYVKDAPEFERWAEDERRRLADAYATALERLAHSASADDDHVGAGRWWKRAVAHDPYASRYVIGLMESLVLADDPGNALVVAEEHIRLLEDDLGVHPPDDLVRLAERIRSDSGHTRPANLTADATVRHGHAISVDTVRPDGTLPAPYRPRSWWWVAVTVIAMMAVATTAVFLFVRRGADASMVERAPSASRVAILPFTYRGAGDLAYIGESMSHLLSTALDGFDGLHVLAPTVDDAAGPQGRLTAESRWLQTVARRMNAARVVTGEVVVVNGSVRIDAQLLRLFEPGHDPAIASVVGSADEFHTLADGLARQLLVLLVGRVQEMHLVAARTTDSLNALKAYLEGVAHRRAGRFEAAFVAFRHAVEIDSAFALAWHGMGVSAAWERMPEWDPGMNATLRAVRHAGNLPHHTRLVIRAYSAIMHGDAPEAERLARAVLSERPDDVQAWFILAWTGCLNPFYGRPVADAREATERAYRYDPYDPDHRSGAAWFASREGNWARLDSLWGDGFATRAVRAFGSGDSAEREQVLVDAPSVAADTLSMVTDWIAMTVRDLAAAARFATVAAARSTGPEDRALAYVRAAQFESALGRWRASDTALAEVAQYDPAWATLYRALWASADFAPVTRSELERLRLAVASWDAAAVRPSVTHTGARAHHILASQLRLYALGRLDLRLGSLDSVLAIAGQLEAVDNPPAALTFAMDRAQSLRGHVAFRRGAYEQALAALDAQPRRIRIQWAVAGANFYPCPEDRFLRGEILLRLGRYEDALRWYATIQDITPYDAHYLAMAQLRRAETYDRLGNATEAIRHYDAFVSLWREGDPEVQPVVERARAARRHAGAGARGVQSTDRSAR